MAPPFFQNCALCRKACLPLYIGKQIWISQPLTILGLMKCMYAYIYLRFSLNGHSRARALTYCFFAWYMFCKFRIFNVLLHTVYDLFLCTASSMKCVGSQVLAVQSSHQCPGDTLTERHAPPGFEPGLTGWVPTLLTTEPSEAGIKVECSHWTTWHSPPIPIILTAVVLLHTTCGQEGPTQTKF